MSPEPELAELLSAHLDGELSPAEQARVDAALAQDPQARREHDELAAVRSALRALPPVDPPLPLARQLAGGGRRRPRWPVAVAGSAVAAALLVVALVVTGGGDGDGDGQMVPPVTEFAARHDVVAADDVGALPADGFEAMDDAELAALEGDVVPPGTLAGGFVRMAGFHDDRGTMHLVYGHDGAMVSVYQQQGAVDFAALPPDGEQMDMDGSPAWLHVGAGPDGVEEIMVLQHGDTVFTFVASVPHDLMMQVVEGVTVGA